MLVRKCSIENVLHSPLIDEIMCHWSSFVKICHIYRSPRPNIYQNEGNATKIYLPKLKFHIQCFHIP